jgi:glycerol-3-phosphate O-acyltransferase/dihydroxyacetone phosphate acyltransferase
VILVPVIRPQDLASSGAGSVRLSSDNQDILEGIDTKFKEQVHARDLISISKNLNVQVEEVMSDSRARLATPVPESDVSALRKQEGVNYKIVPHINQHELFDKVHDSLGQSRSIVIFPEGGSHDRLELLPLKGVVFFYEIHIW